MALSHNDHGTGQMHKGDKPSDKHLASYGGTATWPGARKESPDPPHPGVAAQRQAILDGRSPAVLPVRDDRLGAPFRQGGAQGVAYVRVLLLQCCPDRLLSGGAPHAPKRDRGVPGVLQFFSHTIFLMSKYFPTAQSIPSPRKSDVLNPRRRAILVLGPVPVLLSAAWQRDAVTAAGRILILLFLWRRLSLPPARQSHMPGRGRKKPVPGRP